MTHRWMRIWASRGRFSGILPALAVHVILVLGLVVVRLEVVIRNRPGGRDSTVVPDFAEVFLAQTKERSAIELSVSSDVVVGVRMKVFPAAIPPHLFGVVFRMKID